MNSELFLLFVSALPVFLVGKYIYKKDRNKESSKILGSLFLAGIGSCFLVFIVSYLLELVFPFFGEDTTYMNYIELFINVFVGVSLVEEVCKWLMVYSISYNHQEFDELYDMIVYSAFVALGFALFENILYVFDSGIGVAILRGILAVPGHACDGVLMGYFLGLAKINSINKRDSYSKKYLVLSILVPVICHGFYDYCLLVGNVLFFLIFIIFVIGMDIYIIRKVKHISFVNKRFRYKDKYCTVCGRVVNSDYCPNCGRKNE